MRGVAWFPALVAAGMVVVACPMPRASADNVIPPKDPEHSTSLLFGGFDLWRNGGFGHAGAIWAPEGLARDGFLLKTTFGAGSYRYQSGLNSIPGEVYAGALMPGRRFIRGPLDVAIYAGLDIQYHVIPDDPGNRLRGLTLGLRAGADLWWQPVPNTMVNASVSLSTIGAGYWGRAATGWRVFDRFYAGPEITALGDDNYRQFRFGMHATAFRWAEYEWSAGLGYVIDSDNRSGAYARVGLLTRR